jgi:hypothetical protein
MCVAESTAGKKREPIGFARWNTNKGKKRDEKISSTYKWS